MSAAFRICPKCRASRPAAQRFCPLDQTVMVEPRDLERIGTHLGSYALQEVLGRGAAGTVYGAIHVLLERRVAVKVLHPHFAGQPGAQQRFLREARMAASIRHPNIVDVTDFGVSDDGGMFFVMEWVQGESLERTIRLKGLIPLHEALNIANQMALALATAHDHGIVHRDLKPENVILSERPGRRQLVRRSLLGDGATTETTERESHYDFVKLLDFGIAQLLGDAHASRAVVGTPDYMAPEAARGEAVDHRADIYACGVVLFDMLCGRPPPRPSANGPLVPPSPRSMNPDVEITEAAERLLERALSVDPERRHASMDDFREELQHCYGSIRYHRAPGQWPRRPIAETAVSAEEGAAADGVEKSGSPEPGVSRAEEDLARTGGRAASGGRRV